MKEELRLKSCENRLKRKVIVTKRKEGRKEARKAGRHRALIETVYLGST